ncbi:MAG: universal stress protein, partial [Pseudolabrys sp.]|nr:universal stress protein [Pseudolabrys sp.]
MLKRLLILLGETPSSVSARAYAFRLARQTQAEVAGFAGIDLSSIETRMPGGIGASSYKAKLEEQLTKQAEDARRRLHDAYEAECRSHKFPFEWLSFTGDPIEALYLATEVRDLVVTGHDTAFRGGVHEQYSETLAKLLSLTPRPVIVCPDEIPASDEIMVAYDGSVAAMRAVQMFALLGIGRGKRISVTSIDAAQELAVRRATAAAAYLRSHDYDVETNPIASGVHPSEVLNIEVASRKIGTLVMGAHGHRGLRE